MKCKTVRRRITQYMTILKNITNLCVYVCVCMSVCNTDGKYTYQIPIMFISEELEKGSQDTKGSLYKNFFFYCL